MNVVVMIVIIVAERPRSSARIEQSPPKLNWAPRRETPCVNLLKLGESSALTMVAIPSQAYSNVGRCRDLTGSTDDLKLM